MWRRIGKRQEKRKVREEGAVSEKGEGDGMMEYWRKERKKEMLKRKGKD